MKAKSEDEMELTNKHRNEIPCIVSYVQGKLITSNSMRFYYQNCRGLLS